MISLLLQSAALRCQAVLSGCSVLYIITECVKLHLTWASPPCCKVHGHISTPATAQPSSALQLWEGQQCALWQPTIIKLLELSHGKGQAGAAVTSPRPLTSLFFLAQSPIVKKRMALSNKQWDGLQGADCCLDSVGQKFLGNPPSRALPPGWDHSALSSPTGPRSEISALIAKPIPAFFRAGRAVAGHENRHAKKALYI